MKALQKSNYILFFVFGAGLAGLLLRAALYTVGFDDRGLMSNTHPLHIACWVLAVITAAFVALSVRKLNGSNAYEDNFPANKRGIAAVILTPVCFLASAFSALDLVTDKIGTVWAFLSFAAVPCLAYTGYCRVKGKRPMFLFHGVICVFFALDMICRYRVWSGNPQLPDYTFHLFACAFLTLTAYYRMAFDAGLGSRRMLLLCGLMAVFFCLMALGFSDGRYFCFGGALWASCSLCPIKPLRRKPKNPIQEEP